jgi:Piwi domain
MFPTNYLLQPPKLTFLVVQKRNHLRALARDTPRGNPYPGTLIDDKNVVDGGNPNFYLYSHKVVLFKFWVLLGFVGLCWALLDFVGLCEF